MTARKYNSIINTCIVVGIGSAFFFDKAGDHKWLVGIIAILATIIATTTYFYDRFKSQPESEFEPVFVMQSAQRPVEVVIAPVEVKRLEALGVVASIDREEVIRRLMAATHHRRAAYEILYQRHIAKEMYMRLQQTGAGNVFMDSVQRELVSHLAEAISRVCTPENDVQLEVVITKEGGERSVAFRMRHSGSGRTKAHREERFTPVSPFDVQAWVDATSAPVA